MINLISPTDKQEQRFQNLAFATVLIIYLLILAGGIVRGTGSGMGCPDWPKCFGHWIPPTKVSQLPINYKEIYGAKLKGEVEFNAVKTWIEYVNRLLGVLSGLFVFFTLTASLSYLRKDKALTVGSFVAFLLIGVNGWLGSKVVATELAQYMITVHLLLAIAVVFALLFVLVRSKGWQEVIYEEKPQTISIKWLLFILMVLTLMQTLLGTQVREALDKVVKQLGFNQRDNWIGHLNWSFYVHRSFSLILLGFHAFVLYRLLAVAKNGWLLKLTKFLLLTVVAEIITGAVMGYLGVPAIAQPIHLLLAIVIIGLQFTAWLSFKPALLNSGAVDRTYNFSKI